MVFVKLSIQIHIMKILLSITLNLLFVLSLTGQKKVLIEKFTNNFCGVCPDGSIEIERLQDEHEDLIWISHHKPTTWEENELNNDDSNALWEALGGPGNPTAMIDRTPDNNGLITNIWSWEDNVISQLSDPVLAEVNVADVAFDEETRTFSFRVNASLISPIAPSGYRVSVIMVEDYINNKGGQSSYFNNVAGHPLEGQGDVLWDYEHRNVARAILDDIWGSSDVIPATPIEGEIYSKDYSYTVPETFRLHKMKVVAFVSKHHPVDLYAREILNVVEIDLNDFGFRLSATDDTQSASSAFIDISPNPVSDFLNLEFSEQPETVAIIDWSGVEVMKVKPVSKIFVSDVSDLSPGAYIILADMPEGRVAKKFKVIR